MQPPGLLLYLHLNIAAKRRVSLHQDGRFGIRLVDRASQSAAIVSLRSPWQDKSTARARWRLDAYAGDDAGTELDEFLTQWQQLERAGQTTLDITARSRAGRLQLRFAWTQQP